MNVAATPSPAAASGRPRKRKSDLNRESILIAASKEFSEKGLSGARLEAIAAQTRTAKRMIYYYFEDKEGLFVAVLERAYACFLASQRALDIRGLAPTPAIRRLVEFNYDYYEANVEFVRLLAIENTHQGRYARQSKVIQELGFPMLATIGAVIDAGRADGSFNTGLSAVDVHFLISSVCLARIVQRHTFEQIFSVDLLAPDVRATHKAMLCDAVLGALGAGSANERVSDPAQT